MERSIFFMRFEEYTLNSCNTIVQIPRGLTIRLDPVGRGIVIECKNYPDKFKGIRALQNHPPKRHSALAKHPMKWFTKTERNSLPTRSSSYEVL